MTANALHPGLVRTSFGADDPAPCQRLLLPLLRPFMTSPSRGAKTSIRLASAAALGADTGLYFRKRGPCRLSEFSYDRAIAAHLWRVSAELTGIPAD